MTSKDLSLSDVNIIELNKKLKLPIKFIGTKDLINLVNDDYKNKFIIINLDNSFKNGGGGGTHWTCLSTFEKYPIYFDSYGIICPTDIEIWIKQRYDIFYYWNKQIQGLKATWCGYICLMFLHMLYYDFILKNKPLDQFINSFEKLFNYDNQTKNYNVILNYFNKIL